MFERLWQHHENRFAMFTFCFVYVWLMVTIIAIVSLSFIVCLLTGLYCIDTKYIQILESFNSLGIPFQSTAI